MHSKAFKCVKNAFYSLAVVTRLSRAPIYFKQFHQKSFIMKNLIDFRKTVETGVDPRLYQVDVSNSFTLNAAKQYRSLKHSSPLLFSKALQLAEELLSFL